MNWSEQRVAVIGCGVMAQCLVDGWLKNEIFAAERMILTDANPLGLEALKSKYQQCQISSDNFEAVKTADVVLLSVKPFMVHQVLQEILAQDRFIFKGKILISIAAGLKLSLYHEMIDTPDVTIIRAMPNIACRVDHGLTAVCATSAADFIALKDSSVVKATESIFKPLGGWMLVEDEKLMDVVTALNGSALAFGCMAIEAMADGAVSMGLPRAQALNLASHALLAASSLQIGTGEHPAALRDQITTPGGCTIAGLLTLEDGNFRSVLAKAVQETSRVSRDLGKK
jgi:pyrroline-5-carboxylate reductase